jgi:hypothetical protein
MMAFPQLWFGRSENGPFDKYRVDLDEVPTKEQLLAKGYKLGEEIYIKSFEVTDLASLLRSKGFNLASVEMGAVPTPEPGARFYAETVARISHPEFRVATKIGLNYLAAVVGSREAMLPEFNAAREYARYGEERARVRVHVYENPWFPGRRGSYISLTRVDDLIVAQISLLLKVQYLVVLAENATETPFKSTAHFFDLTTKRIAEIEPLRILRGSALKPIK